LPSTDNAEPSIPSGSIDFASFDFDLSTSGPGIDANGDVGIGATSVDISDVGSALDRSMVGVSSSSGPRTSVLDTLESYVKSRNVSNSSIPPPPPPPKDAIRSREQLIIEKRRELRRREEEEEGLVGFGDYQQDSHGLAPDATERPSRRRSMSTGDAGYADKQRNGRSGISGKKEGGLLDIVALEGGDDPLADSIARELRRLGGVSKSVSESTPVDIVTNLSAIEISCSRARGHHLCLCRRRQSVTHG